ncbi:unnamed protein product [Prunus armeniaca]|uniref:Uncharacterized protein n=1 Tax=Prunus armeniaca TaxID=36596 RepID=A0A6J5VIC4_PRUAR|nr:unnamed protein product [Prunus armeniaca]
MYGERRIKLWCKVVASRPNPHLRLVYYVHFGLVKVGLSLRAYATGRMRIGSQHGDVEWLAVNLTGKKSRGPNWMLWNRRVKVFISHCIKSVVRSGLCDHSIQRAESRTSANRVS